VGASHTKSTFDSAVSEIEAEGGRAIGVACDVGRRDDIFAMVAKTARAFGTVDILVNNTQGFGIRRSGRRRPLGSQRSRTSTRKNGNTRSAPAALATLWEMKAVFPWMKDRGGKIINFGSPLGQIGGEGTAAYNATKEAIRALSRTAAREWGKYNINVNVINPAVVTDAMLGYLNAHSEQAEAMLGQVPLRRWGDPVKDAGGSPSFSRRAMPTT
jgi:2-hydroxycyclohexanecarboxyl-CoA dehydrogenase